MDRRTRNLAVVVLTLLASTSTATAQWRLGHSPIHAATRHESLQVRAQIDGQTRSEPELTLYYAYDADRFVSMDLFRRGTNTYVANIPASADTARELRYYIVSRSDNTVQRVGTAREPVRVELHGSASGRPAGALGVVVGLTGVLLGGELLLGWWSGRVRRRTELRDGPWSMTLAPVGRLYGGVESRHHRRG